MEIKTMPSLEIVQKNMDNKKYAFDVVSIDKQIPVPQLTKFGEQIFLYRKKINVRTNPMPYVIKSVYYLIDANANILGKIPVHNNGMSNTLEIDYFIKTEYQGKGLGTIALSTVVDDIFLDKEFDGLTFRRNTFEDEVETKIENITLSINEDNIASQYIAKKNGFIQVDETTYVLTLDDYKKSHGLEEVITRGK